MLDAGEAWRCLFYVLVVPEKSTAPRRVYVYNFRTLPARTIMYVRQIHFHVASEKKSLHKNYPLKCNKINIKNLTTSIKSEELFVYSVIMYYRVAREWSIK